MTVSPTATPWQHRRVHVNGLHLHCVEAGAGPLVLLLHGFPEFWYSWHHQLPALAAAGFRALAPDLRGYNESDKPAGVANYRMGPLLSDVAGLIRESDERRAIVVGHDWGGAIAWKFAMLHPEMVERLIVVNAPHPAAFARELGSPGQLARSAYGLFFQLPWLPERVIAAGDFALLERMLRREPVRPGAFSPEDVRLYKQALARPGALTAALNYYRAVARYPGELRKGLRPILAPTLLIWGERDRYLGIRLTEGLQRWVPNLRLARLPGVSHWAQNDNPEQVNRLMLDFLRA